MSGEHFAAEKEGLVAGPARDGTSTQPHANPRQPDGAARDPSITPPYSALRVVFASDIPELINLARKSRTFKSGEEELGDARIDWLVVPLDAERGGGHTEPVSHPAGFEVTIDPSTVKQGYHLFDVFIHEYGHMVELWRLRKRGIPHKRWADFERRDRYYHRFTNTVLRELGLRTIKDPHL